MATSGLSLSLMGSLVETITLVVFASDQISLPPVPILLAFTIAVNLFLLICYNFLIYPNFVSPVRHLPGPKGGLPLVGRAQTMFERPPGKSYYDWMHTFQHNGLLRFQGLWNRHMVLVTSPAALAEMLVSKTYQFEKPENGRDILRRVIGDGLVVAEGDEHRFQRKRIMPSFSFRHIKDLYPVMWSKANKLVERINLDLRDNESITVEISEWAAKATLDAIGVAALGRDFNSIYNDQDELVKLFRILTEATPESTIIFALNLLFGPKNVHMLPWKRLRDAERHSARLRVISRQLVNDKREAIAKRGDDHYDILSVLIKSNDFSDDELVDQMLTFLAAGSDTTSLTFTWTTYLLAKNPHVQKRLRAEIMSVQQQLLDFSQDNDQLATILESLPYLNGIFHEVLRLYPTVPMTQRIANTNTTLLGHPIPKGTQFVLSIMAVNRSPELWGPDAEDFKPERWIDAETGRPNNHGGASSNYGLLTFLAGPRSCIGQNFARAELRCLLASWVMNFEVEDANSGPIVPVGTVTLKPAMAMYLKVKKVQKVAM